MSSEDFTSECVLQGNFHLFGKGRKLYSVILNQTNLTYQVYKSNASQQSIDIKDIVGCHVMRGRKENDEAAYFCVYSYPFRKTMFSKRIRWRFTVTFSISDLESFDGNKKIAEKWRSSILALVQEERMKSCKEQKLIIREAVLKKYLILLNPFSGRGKAKQLFREKIAVMLGEADVPYDLIITEHANHARKMMNKLDLSKWAGVIIVSGDGLIYEVLNGLLEREDWKEALKMPIGALPGGSSNALCVSINCRAGEPYVDNIVLHSTFVLLKHIPMPLDIVYVENSKQKAFSFLSTCWGFVADVDIESEKYRHLGPVRFTMVAIARVVNLRHYHGKVSFLPTKPYKPPVRNKNKSRSKSVSYVPSSTSFSATETQTDTTWDDIVAHSNKVGEDDLNASNNEARAHRKSMPQWITSDKKGAGRLHRSASVIENEAVFQAVMTDLEDITETNDHIVSAEISEHCSSHTDTYSDNNIVEHNETLNTFREENCNYLVPLEEPLPANWVTIEDDFIFVLAVYQSHLAPDLRTSPDATLDDGIIHLSIMRADISRGSLLGTVAANDGTYQPSQHIEEVACYAFRFEPSSTDGNVTVDGESLERGPIQGQILPGLATIMAKENNSP